MALWRSETLESAKKPGMMRIKPAGDSYVFLSKRLLLHVFPFLLLVNLAACMPIMYPSAPTSAGQILQHWYVTEDGEKLPLTKWSPSGSKAWGIIVAVHGFNDYHLFFQQPAEYFAAQKIISYAYDQRGFGASPHRGYWAGVDTYASDLRVFIRLVKNQYPQKPIYLLGASMGGAIIINALAKTDASSVNGIILAAPAVWSRNTMPWYQTSLLWLLSHSLPWLTLTADNLNITPSDNEPMLRALAKDPLIIRKSRVDTLLGLVNLMDQAAASADLMAAKTLFLYGEKDEIIPPTATYQFLQGFLKSNRTEKKVAFYRDGYHMLLRDLNGHLVWEDILYWIHSDQARLPSHADVRAQRLINQKLFHSNPNIRPDNY